MILNINCLNIPIKDISDCFKIRGDQTLIYIRNHLKCEDIDRIKVESIAKI